MKRMMSPGWGEAQGAVHSTEWGTVERWRVVTIMELDSAKQDHNRVGNTGGKNSTVIHAAEYEFLFSV